MVAPELAYQCEQFIDHCGAVEHACIPTGSACLCVALSSEDVSVEPWNKSVCHRHCMAGWDSQPHWCAALPKWIISLASCCKNVDKVVIMEATQMCFYKRLSQHVIEVSPLPSVTMVTTNVLYNSFAIPPYNSTSYLFSHSASSPCAATVKLGSSEKSHRH